MLHLSRGNEGQLGFAFISMGSDQRGDKVLLRAVLTLWVHWWECNGGAAKNNWVCASFLRLIRGSYLTTHTLRAKLQWWTQLPSDQLAITDVGRHLLDLLPGLMELKLGDNIRTVKYFPFSKTSTEGILVRWLNVGKTSGLLNAKSTNYHNLFLISYFLYIYTKNQLTFVHL